MSTCNCKTMMLNPKVVYHHPELKRITKSSKGDWYDLRVVGVLPKKNKGVNIPKKYHDLYIDGEYKFFPGDSGLISLGISIKLPNGYEADFRPRSSTFKTWGLLQTNSCAVIDNSYQGQNDVWWFPYYCPYPAETLRFNDAICQVKIVENMPPVLWEEVESLEGKNRDGIGASGREGR